MRHNRGILRGNAGGGLRGPCDERACPPGHCLSVADGFVLYGSMAELLLVDVLEADIFAELGVGGVVGGLGVDGGGGGCCGTAATGGGFALL